MITSKPVTALVAALSMLSASTVASAAPAASKLSLSSQVRAGASMKKSNKLTSTAWIIGALVAAAVVVGVVVIADDNDNPTSA